MPVGSSTAKNANPFAVGGCLPRHNQAANLHTLAVFQAGQFIDRHGIYPREGIMPQFGEMTVETGARESKGCFGDEPLADGENACFRVPISATESYL